VRTRSQRIRTAGEIDFQAILFEAVIPLYLGIAQRADQLRALKFSLKAIADELGVSKKTVRKGLASVKPRRKT
jgi:hypothetical protein